MKLFDVDCDVVIRQAEQGDVEALLCIYAPYVEKTAITFEYEVPKPEEFSKRMRDIMERYPYLVAVCEGEILGYAYAGAFKARAAYDWSVETTIYLKMGVESKGIGKKLYQALEEVLRRQNIININACIAYPNPGSITFHEKMGYQKAAHFTKCGYKLGKWYDMIWMEKMLGNHPDEPKGVIAVKDVRWEE